MQTLGFNTQFKHAGNMENMHRGVFYRDTFVTNRCNCLMIHTTNISVTTFDFFGLNIYLLIVALTNTNHV